ncbi:YkoP family protein [Virgibacillus kimchii]
MKNYLLGVWNFIDPIYYNCSRLHYIPDTGQENTLLRVRLTRYKGTAVTLSDGTVIHKNDLLLKIHLHNVKMIKELNNINSDLKRAVYIYHTIKKALPKLVAYLKAHPRYKDIKAIIGITSLYKGSERLGFEVVAIRNKYYQIFKKITFLPINLIAGNKRYVDPVYLFMSTSKLNAKYDSALHI